VAQQFEKGEAPFLPPFKRGGKKGGGNPRFRSPEKERKRGVRNWYPQKKKGGPCPSPVSSIERGGRKKGEHYFWEYVKRGKKLNMPRFDLYGEGNGGKKGKGMYDAREKGEVIRLGKGRITSFILRGKKGRKGGRVGPCLLQGGRKRGEMVCLEKKKEAFSSIISTRGERERKS